MAINQHAIIENTIAIVSSALVCKLNHMDQEHLAKRVDQVGCAIITVSDSRTVDTDTSGSLIRALLTDAGHHVVGYRIVPDEPSIVTQTTLEYCQSNDCLAVLVTGGTGLAPRDTTYEALSKLYDKQIDGFGELFRMLSYEQIGSAAMLSRASAGLCQATAIFSMPGSIAAVRLAMEKLVLEQISHLAGLLTPHR